ncbi:MAG: efflux RND transporter periplasmic adaptor subunit [Bryobacteraceae bacterium]
MQFKSSSFLAFSAALAALFSISACGTSHGRPAPVKQEARSAAPAVETVKVLSRRLDSSISLPAELLPYQAVNIYPKVTGFLQWIGVDRGSRVKRGQTLARLEAPEIVAQKFEAQAKLRSAQSKQTATEAKLAADQGTYKRLKVAAATPGVISDEELDVAEKRVEGDRATVASLLDATEAARENLHSVETLGSYLAVTAPFDGVITERNVHPGDLVGPASGRTAGKPMLRLEQVNRLRLVVAVPEAYVAGARAGQNVNFSVVAFPGKVFQGVVSRIADSLDQRTRTMPVEMDVWNPDWTLHSGMFPQVSWPIERPYPTLFVPQSAVVRTMESTFVIGVRGGVTKRVEVKTGVLSQNLIEVFGDLHPGEEVVLHASEELRPNTRVKP